MKKKSDKSEKQEDSELEELIDEKKLKEIIEEVGEEPEELKTNIDKNQFREFLQTESSAPILEEIAGTQELGGRFFSTGTGTNVQEDDGAFRYDAQVKEDEPKYQGDVSSVGQNLEELDITKVGRDINQPQVKEAGFVHSVEQTDSPMQEKYQNAQRVDMEKVGRENPFETKIQEVEKKKSDYIIK